jgi:phosphatidylglycerophosphate synthase
MSSMWLAHALTASRIPIAVVFWLTYGDWRWSLGLIAFAAVTDAADGTVARWALRRHPPAPGYVSPGEWLDPVAQVHDPVPWGLFALIIAREIVLLPLAGIYRVVVHGRSEHAFKAGAVGKAATVAELFAIAALIAYRPAVLPLAIAAGTLGLLAVVQYIVRASHHNVTRPLYGGTPDA